MFGPAGGIAFAAIVAMSCFGAVNSSFFTSSRIIFTAAKDGFLPKRFAKLHPTRKTPINSIVRNLRVCLGERQLNPAIASASRLDQRYDRHWRLFLSCSVPRLQRLAVLLLDGPWSPDIEEPGTQFT